MAHHVKVVFRDLQSNDRSILQSREFAPPRQCLWTRCSLSVAEIDRHLDLFLRVLLIKPQDVSLDVTRSINVDSDGSAR